MQATRRLFWSRLSVRLAVMLALALLPIGLFAVWQTRKLTLEVAASQEAAMLGATLRSADEETSVILRARGLMAGLAQAVLPVIGDTPACVATVRQFAKAEPLATLVAYFPNDGVMSCTSTGTTLDMSMNPLFMEIRAAKVPYFIVNKRALVSKTSVLGISHPVFDAAGHYLGYVSISLPQTSLTDQRENAEVFADYKEGLLSFWTFDRDGGLLTASVGLDIAEQQLPTTRTLKNLVGSVGEVFSDQTKDGEWHSYAVVPIAAGELYLMSRWRPTGNQLTGLGDYMPVALMWLAALIVAVAAAELLVARHVRILNGGIAAFAGGDRRLRDIDLKHAPVELRELGDAYLSMTEAITHGEARMEDTLHQKEVLLREVHHRVKNNLQLIASIMNIQMRKAASAETRSLLKGLQDQVISLATVHHGLYQTSGMADVQVGELFTDIVRQITTMSAGGEKRFVITTDVDDIRMIPDQAVPLSLMMTEALTNAIKHSDGTEAVSGPIGLRLKRMGDGEAVLEVQNTYAQNTASAPDAGGLDPVNTGLGSQLIAAFGRQLGGKLEQIHHDGRHVLRMTFEVSALAAAEYRAGEYHDVVP